MQGLNYHMSTEAIDTIFIGKKPLMARLDAKKEKQD